MPSFLEKKKVTEDISYNFVRFHKKNLICFCGIENGLALGETRYRFVLGRFPLKMSPGSNPNLVKRDDLIPVY